MVNVKNKYFTQGILIILHWIMLIYLCICLWYVWEPLGSLLIFTITRGFLFGFGFSDYPTSPGYMIFCILYTQQGKSPQCYMQLAVTNWDLARACLHHNPFTLESEVILQKDVNNRPCLLHLHNHHHCQISNWCSYKKHYQKRNIINGC